jgi:purine-nucleoside phosphorylase
VPPPAADPTGPASTSPDPAHLAARAAAVLAEATGVPEHDVALVLGSGWVRAADALGEPQVELPVTDLPGFLPPAVAGHAGRVRSVQVGEQRVLVLLGRTHLYEGRGVEPVVHGCGWPLRRAAAPWCSPTPPAASARGCRSASRCSSATT